MTNLLNVAGGLSDLSSELGGLDPIIRDVGPLEVFDFTNPLCNGNADGALTNNALLSNLVEGTALQAHINGTTTANLPGLAGISLPGDGSFIDLGSPPLATLQSEYLVTAWFKFPVVGYSTAAYTAFLVMYGSGYNQNTSPIFWDNGPDGKTIRAAVGSGTASAQRQYSIAALLGTPVQVAFHWRPDGFIELFVNGKSVSSTLSAIEALAIPTSSLAFGLGVKMTAYGASIINLSSPRRDAAIIVANDWAARNGKFV